MLLKKSLKNGELVADKLTLPDNGINLISNSVTQPIHAIWAFNFLNTKLNLPKLIRVYIYIRLRAHLSLWLSQKPQPLWNNSFNSKKNLNKTKHIFISINTWALQHLAGITTLISLKMRCFTDKYFPHFKKIWCNTGNINLIWLLWANEMTE